MSGDECCSPHVHGACLHSHDLPLSDVQSIDLFGRQTLVDQFLETLLRLYAFVKKYIKFRRIVRFRSSLSESGTFSPFDKLLPGSAESSTSSSEA